MSTMRGPVDLPLAAFLILRNVFFGAGASPKPYRLRDKRNTQDDPFDEHVHKLLSRDLPSDVQCVRAPGPLITPDMVVLRPEACRGAERALLASEPSRIVALEVKKLERARTGTVARASGMDYNTTPPCGTVRVYDAAGHPLDIRGFYLFVCQEADAEKPGQFRLTALALCDGNLLNTDFDYYLSIVGQRTKQVGLGTYGNGANRVRPMLIFANPLGAAQLDRNVTLVHSRSDLETQVPGLACVGVLRRSTLGGGTSLFHCYRMNDDVAPGHSSFDVTNPFPTPERVEATQPRGRFRVDVEPGS
ncbi:MAG TPA: hypothetical protein VNE39_06230 [Planctomycetota bacterium]|nr:hypothetical protein [Planctomycetota bacterium]